MSTAHFHNIAQLRFWNEAELQHRDLATKTLVDTCSRSLRQINPAWTFARVEGPMLTPRDMLSAEYTDDDIWVTPNTIAEQQIVLRAETTASTYAMVRAMNQVKKVRMPAAFWQVGKSFRREKTATAARLRFFEFTQFEMQCLFSKDTKANYRAHVLPILTDTISWLTRAPARVVPSDRTPAYAQSTMDVEVLFHDTWREMASVSLRTDFAEDVLNLEIAVGMDRIVEVFFANQPT